MQMTLNEVQYYNTLFYPDQRKSKLNFAQNFDIIMQKTVILDSLSKDSDHWVKLPRGAISITLHQNLSVNMFLTLNID